MFQERKVAYTQDHDELFHYLVTQFGEDLMRLAYTYVKDTNITEDIIQDVFLRAYENIDDFRGQSSYRTYLYRITINRCYDYLRSWSYKNMMISDKISSLFHSSNQVDEEVIRNDEQYTLGKKVFTMPVKYREVIVLYYYKELSVDEISAILHCSKNTVKTRLRRARAKLKVKLEAEGEMERG